MNPVESRVDLVARRARHSRFGALTVLNACVLVNPVGFDQVPNERRRKTQHLLATARQSINTEPQVLQSPPRGVSTELAGKPSIMVMAAVRSMLGGGDIEKARALSTLLPPNEAGQRLRRLLAPPRIQRVDQNGSASSSNFEWLRNHSSAYAGRWVALLGGQLVLDAPCLSVLRERLKELELDAPPLVHLIE